MNPVSVAISVLETELVQQVVTYLGKQVYEEVCHLIEQISHQSKHYSENPPKFEVPAEEPKDVNHDA